MNILELLTEFAKSHKAVPYPFEWENFRWLLLARSEYKIFDL